jgi:hypothetical protein
MYVKKNIPNLMLALTCEEEGITFVFLLARSVALKKSIWEASRRKNFSRRESKYL